MAHARARGDLVVRGVDSSEGATTVVERVALRLRALRLEQPQVAARPRLGRRRRHKSPTATILVCAECQARAVAHYQLSPSNDRNALLHTTTGHYQLSSPNCRRLPGEGAERQAWGGREQSERRERELESTWHKIQKGGVATWSFHTSIAI